MAQAAEELARLQPPLTPREKPIMAWNARTPQPGTPANVRSETRLPQAAEEVAGREPHVLAREADLITGRHGHRLRPRVQRVADDALAQLQAALALRAFPRHAQHSAAVTLPYPTLPCPTLPSHHRCLAYHAPTGEVLVVEQRSKSSSRVPMRCPEMPTVGSSRCVWRAGMRWILLIHCRLLASTESLREVRTSEPEPDAVLVLPPPPLPAFGAVRGSPSSMTGPRGVALSPPASLARATAAARVTLSFMEIERRLVADARSDSRRRLPCLRRQCHATVAAGMRSTELG